MICDSCKIKPFEKPPVPEGILRLKRASWLPRCIYCNVDLKIPQDPDDFAMAFQGLIRIKDK